MTSVSTGGAPLLSVRDIHTYYGNSYVLQGVSLEVGAGQVVVVLGRNGAGKTTLVRSIIGFTRPRRGEIVFEGQTVSGMQAHRIAKLGVGIVPQGRRLFGTLSVRENLEIARRETDGGWTMDSIVERFPRLGERMGNRAGKLSGGEQQMLAVGRALMGNPRFLLMDEPSEGLAPLMVRELSAVIRDMKQQGLSILMVEQNLNFALEHADYVYILSDGVVVHGASPDDFRADHQTQARYLGV